MLKSMAVLGPPALLVALMAPASGGKPDDTLTTTGATSCSASRCDLSAASSSTLPGREQSGPFGSSSDASGDGSKPVCTPVVSSEVATLPSGERGQWYFLNCGGSLSQGNLGPGTVTGAPLWAPLGQAGAPAPAVDPVRLAAQAVSRLDLPKPEVHLNPGADGPQVVRVPTWLWVEPGQWQPVRATADAPGVSVVAVATPSSVEWEMGDGASVTCKGAGTPYDRRFDAASASPDCGHTYLRSSRGEPDGSFPVSVTVHWSVSWSGGGQGGTFPDLATTSTVPVRVVEVQSLVTG